MKEIELKVQNAFPSYMHLNIMDEADGKERRRGTITCEYSEYDVKPLIREGKNLDKTLEHYRVWLDNTVRRYLLCDFKYKNNCADNIIEIIRHNIQEYFK